ncbi:hypothetical protein BW685_27135 [Burkholderia ubonensis]|uniref:Uncharacterized protein n=1 Tax=Burkholderia ubonensis TaxID=101571 RepID=A0A1R1J3K2_9BURK|nr:hypothetical protein BW685_27135 [Burkholderia ubonensis]
MGKRCYRPFRPLGRQLPRTARLIRGVGECARITLLKSVFSPLSAPVMCGSVDDSSDGCRFGFNL